MKSLTESIFGDNITKDPFEIMLDHIDPNKYSADDVKLTLEELFYASGKQYSFYSQKSALKKFQDELRKGKYLMLIQDEREPLNNYIFGWIDKQHSNWFVRYRFEDYAELSHSVWHKGVLDFNYDLTSESGVGELIWRCRNIGYEYCVLITDKKKIDAFKKRLLELTK